MLGALGEAALRGILLAAVVQGVLRLTRVRQARLLLASWTVVLAASVAMPVLPHFIPVPLPFDPAFPDPLAGVMAALPLPPSSWALAGQGVPVMPPGWSPAWPWWEAVYAVICCAMLGRVLLGLGLSVRLLARAVPAPPGWARGRRVRISRDVAGPVTIARVILLPADALAWPAGTREAVLAHEQAHVARWDFAMLAVSQLNRALFWFSPLPWWLHRRLVTLCELASDDQAMAATGDRLGYAEILLEMGRRSGSALPGPAMARPATLLHRIDRILRDPVVPHPVGRPRQLLLTAGIAGLSLGMAGLAHGPARSPAPAPATSIAGWRAPGEGLILAAPPIPGIEEAARPVADAATPSGDAAARAWPPFGPRSGRPSSSRTVLSREAAVPFPRPVLPASRAAPRSAVKAVAAFLPPPHAPDRLHPVPNGPAGSSEGSDPRARDGGVRPANAGAAAMATSGAPAAGEIPPSPAHQAGGDGFPTLQSGLDGIAGTTCTGSIAVGLRAAGGVPGRPNVSPGQSVPAHAQFFRKDGAMLWVRFNAFGRPPLDLPVRFARNGMTWTGEYGIAYTVQAVGGDRLAGLAALVANDSARLDFGCSRSTGRML